MPIPPTGSTGDPNDATDNVPEAQPIPTEENANMALTIIEEQFEEQADRRIRRMMHDGRMFFSIIDVIGVLTDSPRPRNYWTDMKRRITDEGFRQLHAKCVQLKLPSRDGKNYRTDAADTETLLRIIQSVPSPKAEPIKQWLAKVGAARLEEAQALRQAEAAALAHANEQTNAASHQIDPPTIEEEIAALRAHQPRKDAPALDWAAFFHAMGDLYERQASLAHQMEALQAHSRYVEAELDKERGFSPPQATRL